MIVGVNGQNCVGTASFVPGHATQIYDNDCIVYHTEKVDDLFENCNSGMDPTAIIHGFNNRFYTPQANGESGTAYPFLSLPPHPSPTCTPTHTHALSASASCDCCGTRPLKDLPKGLEDNFTSSFLPDGETIIEWGRQKLFGE